MLQKEQVDHYLIKSKDTIEKAHKELLDVKLIQKNDPTEFPFLMNQLVEIDQEINDLLASASDEQRKQLEEAQQILRETKTIMIRGV
ncbi:DUF2524 family protein [Bacillaceae bacterium IKA-2]|nr:DUF2524 family protein [Bacillaceae bacterium IKA-2]